MNPADTVAPQVGRDRDYAAERKALLAQADAARAAAHEIDLEGAVSASLKRMEGLVEAASERAESAADDARSKIHLQQERYKASLLSDGYTLDETVESSGEQRGVAGVDDNKYSLMIDRRRRQQEQERLAQ